MGNDEKKTVTVDWDWIRFALLIISLAYMFGSLTNQVDSLEIRLNRLEINMDRFHTQ